MESLLRQLLKKAESGGGEAWLQRWAKNRGQWRSSEDSGAPCPDLPAQRDLVVLEVRERRSYSRRERRNKPPVRCREEKARREVEPQSSEGSMSAPFMEDGMNRQEGLKRQAPSPPPAPTGQR